LRLTGGTGRRIQLLLTVVATFVIAVSGCSNGDAEQGSSVAWSADPCGLVPPPDVLAAFGTNPVPAGISNPGECRFRVGNVLLRVVVLSDHDTCPGATRSYEAVGNELVRPIDAADGIFVAEPAGDVIVCTDEATYVMSADGSTDELIDLAGTSPSQRSD